MHLLLMSNVTLMFSRLRSHFNSSYTIKYSYSHYFFPLLLYTLHFSISTWFSPLPFNLYRNLPTFFNSVIVVQLIIFLRAISSFIVEAFIVQNYFSPSLGLFTFRQCMYLIIFFATQAAPSLPAPLLTRLTFQISSRNHTNTLTQFLPSHCHCLDTLLSPTFVSYSSKRSQISILSFFFYFVVLEYR